jgi:hypothetical protein
MIQKALNEAIVLAIDLERVMKLHNGRSKDKVFEVHFKFNDHDVLVNSDTKFEAALKAYFDATTKDASVAVTPTPKLKLYVWDRVRKDHDYGIMFAYADHVERARTLLMAEPGNEECLQRPSYIYDNEETSRSLAGGS